jgi:hypothetical protein
MMRPAGHGTRRTNLRISRTKKKAGSEFPPFAESLKRLKLPPRVPGGIIPNLPRFYALVDGIKRESERMAKKRRKG